MSNRPSLEDAAKEILRISVRELHVAANGPIPAQPVLDRFNNLPWKPSDLRPALVFAQEKGWVTEDGRLTATGFGAAPI